RQIRNSTVHELSNLISTRLPTSGMPAFDLPAQELDALAALVRSLNAPSVENTVRGNPAAGEQFFFGRGQCVTCHMISGNGETIGPDLSNVGREMTADEIQAKLLDPSARISPGYDLITVQLHDGSTIRGFARNRSNFD